MIKKILTFLCTVLILTSCSGEYAATAGNTKITSGEINFYLSSIKLQMTGTELSNDEDWQTQEIEGMKAIDFAKERALESAAENVAYIEIAEYLGIELSDEDNQRIESIKDNLVTQYGGESGYKSFLKTQDLDDSFIDMLCKSMICSEKLTDKAVSDNPLTDDEKAAKFAEIKASQYKAKHILFAKVDTTTRSPLSDEEIAQAKTLAEDVYSRVQNGEDFDTLMNEYSEDPGLATNPDGYVFGKGEMVTEFEECVEGLSIGQVGFAESELGYHIIKRLDIEMSDVEEDIESELRSERLEQAMEKWKTESGFVVEKNDAVFESIS